jgi:hypothetical protein
MSLLGALYFEFAHLRSSGEVHRPLEVLCMELYIVKIPLLAALCSKSSSVISSIQKFPHKQLYIQNVPL